MVEIMKMEKVFNCLLKEIKKILKRLSMFTMEMARLLCNKNKKYLLSRREAHIPDTGRGTVLVGL